MARATRPPILPQYHQQPWWLKGFFSPDRPFGRWFQKVFGRFLQGRGIVSESSIFLHDLPEEKRSPDTYARLLQCLALEQRHQLSFMQFQDLVEALRQWHKPWRALMVIRKKYPSQEFRRPPIFKEPIPGIALYEKHRDSLTDQRTGHSFISFEEDEEGEGLTEALPQAT